MSFLSKISSLGKKLGKSVASNVGGALAQRAGKALGNGVNAVSSSFMSRISGQVPSVGNFPGKLPGASAVKPLVQKYGTNKFI